MQITREQLNDLSPRPANAAKAAIWDGYCDVLTSDDGRALFAQFGITQARGVHFIANAAHECDGFTLIWESGNYRAERILEIFGEGRHSARVTPAEARRLAGNAYALFERVYGVGNPRKAAELGNVVPGDGYKHRGCGIMQLTGRNDHEAKAAALGCDVADLATPYYSLAACLHEWREKGCNQIADRGFDDATITTIRKLINGGRNGLPQVRQLTAEARAIFLPAKPLSGPQEAQFEPLRLGSRSEVVKALQAALAASGFPAGPADGRFGIKTETAVAAWQVAHGQIGTGRVDSSALLDDILQSRAAPLPGFSLMSEAKAIEVSSTAAAGSTAQKAGGVLGTFGTFMGLDQLLTGGWTLDVVLSAGEHLQKVDGRLAALNGRTMLTLGAIIIGGLVWRSGRHVVQRVAGDIIAGFKTVKPQ
jgi:putative chitinase